MTISRWYFLQPDGAADEPQAELDGRTPLQAARIPNLRALAGHGAAVRLRTIPEGFPPGSDVGNLSLLGYDPRRYYTGRAPIEAAAMGIVLGNEQLAFRCNLVHIDHSGDEPIMVDFSAGHIESDEAAELIQALNRAIDGPDLHPGVSYRHILVTDEPLGEASTTPPHDIQGQAIGPHLPQGAHAEVLRAWMDAARAVLANHPVNQARVAAGKLPATDIWLWGGGRATTIPTLAERYDGWRGSMITAVDLLRGIAVLAGMRNLDVPGATGFIDTNYAGKAQAAIDDGDSNLVFVHLEAPDESSHMGRLDYKLEALERFDEAIVGPIRAAAEREGAGIIVSPDHPTLIRTKTHALADVPCLAWWPGAPATGRDNYDERFVQDGELIHGWDLIDELRTRTA